MSVEYMVGQPENRLKIRRVLILTKYFSYGFGGTPEAVLLLARALNEAGIETDVCAKGILISNAGKLADLPRKAAEDRKSAKLDDYDLLIVAGAWLFSALPLVLKARALKVPVIYMPKGQLCRVEFSRMRDLRRVAYFLGIEMWLPLLAQRIVFTSELERIATLLPRYIKDRKSVIVPELFDPARITIEPREPLHSSRPLRFGFIAQISPRKGLAELVDGFLEYCAKNPRADSILIVAGTALAGSGGYFLRIRDRVRAHANGERVKFLGQVSGEERAKFYASVDVVVIPSKFESFGLTLVEALASGAAVLACQKVGALEYFHGCGRILSLDTADKDRVRSGLESVTEKLPALAAAWREGEPNIPTSLQGQSVVKAVLGSFG